MKKSKRLIMTCIVMAVIMLLSAVAIFAATYWDAAGGGTISAGSTGGTGNAVPSDYANKSDYPISGLRISIVNSYSGQTRTGCLNFVAEGDGTYLGRKMFQQNYNKVQMFSNWNGSFNIVDSTSMGLAQPTAYGAQTFAGRTSETLSEWEENDRNLRVVASLLICGNTSRAGEPLETLLNPGDRIIIEALYPLRINNINYYLTCSEYASMCASAYGNINAVAGNTSNKGQISFIGKTLNYYWPMGMYAPEGSISACGIGKAEVLHSPQPKNQATFWQLISQAYGMHIAYTDSRPNNVTFTVNEVFDIVSDDGLSVTGDTQIYSNSFTVASGSTINIVDYLSTTRLAGNRNGDWPAWPRTGVTISANGTTYSNPWSYRFDGSWANGLTGHSSNVNQQYVIGSDGITITVRYVPNDAHLTIRNKVATDSVNIQQKRGTQSSSSNCLLLLFYSDAACVSASVS